MELNVIHNLNCIEGLKLLPDNCIDCCVTSPPYFGLRDYGTDEQIGLEETPQLFVNKLSEVFEQVRRVLKPEGTLWLNLGDSYTGYKGENYGKTKGNLTARTPIADGNFEVGTPKTTGLKEKNLIGIPWKTAFALQENGWYLRQDIIWHKPNPMPESVTDRCTKAHEYIFLLTKSPRYYYDHNAIKTEVTKESVKRLAQDIANQKGSERVPGKTNGSMKAVIAKGLTIGGKKGREYNPLPGDPNFRNGSEQWGRQYVPDLMANKKSVWTVTTKPFKEAHFATFPEDLIVDCIKAGCPEGGIILDPFMGAGTTALVARKLNRNYIGFELNKDYISIATKRLHDELGFFL